MEAPDVHPFLRPGRRNTYTAYSIWSFVAWAILWVILANTLTKGKLGYVLLCFIGWVIGWASATLARILYPPPKHTFLPRPTAKPED
jgi:hypothetical protein